MITGNAPKNQSPGKKKPHPPQNAIWQRLLAEAIRDPHELLKMLNLPPDPRLTPDTASHFPLRVPRGFVAKMQPGDPDDPLLRQILPHHAEQHASPGFQADPVCDLQAARGNGILQKYPGRALIITTGACPVHCRYCFRQHFPYAEQQASRTHWHALLQTLQADTTINEVILSGGDPLSLSDARLQALCQPISRLSHIHTLRIHTRFPLVLPERIDPDFLDWFSALDIQKVVVIHANHANEFCDASGQALQQLRQAGCLLLNQSVLLKGINDTAERLIQLSHTLHRNGVLPYYLHLLDKVQGAAHFEVSQSQAVQLMNAIRQQLPGYLVPRLVREVSGKRSKTPII